MGAAALRIRPWTPERARDALSYCSPDCSYEDWIAFGQALHSEWPDETGLDLWCEWSSVAGSFPGRKDLEARWRGFRSGGGRTMAFVHGQAKARGWHDDARPVQIDPAEAERRRFERAERDARAAAECEAAHQKAAAQAVATWNAAAPAKDHPYLRAKGVKPHDTRIGRWDSVDQMTGEIRTLDEQALLIPARDFDERICTLEAILSQKLPDGRNKLFLRGGAKSGRFFRIGEAPVEWRGRQIFVLAEGFATGASIHECTRHQVIVCFDAGNLAPVARELRVRHPEAVILLAADNDQFGGRNTGVEAARKAAAEVGGLVAVPEFTDLDGNPKDFNDLHQREGAVAVIEQIVAGLRSEPIVLEPAAAPVAGDALLADLAQAVDETGPVLDLDVEPDADAQIVEFEHLLAGGSFVLTEPTIGDRASSRSSGLSARLQPAVMPIGADSRDGVSGTFPLTEMGNCHRVVAAHGDDLRFVPEAGAWLVWSGENWLWDTYGARVRGLIGRLAASIYADGADRFDDAEHFLKWARKSQEARTIRNVQVLLEDVADLRIPVAAIDGDPFLVGVDGARRVIDLRAGKCRAAERSDFVTRSLGVSEIGSAEQAIAWKRFLGDVFMNDADVLDWFKRFFGYCLTGCYGEQLFIFAHGSGSNGKSVLVKTMKSLSGEYCRTVAAGTLMEQKRGAGDASPDIADLAGARLLLASETSAGSAFDEQFLKGWTGGDPQVARKLYRDQFAFEPVGKLFIAGNYRPRIGGTDHAIWRRVRLLPFVRTFSDEEKDPTMLDKLRAELPHILAWAIEGCLDWQKRRLTDVPKAMKDAGRQYLVEQDILGEFLQEMTLSGPELRVTSKELFDCYRSWMMQCNLKPVSRQAFGRQLAERGFPSRHTNRGAVYDGLDLASWTGGVGGTYAERRDPAREAFSPPPPF